MNLNFSKGHLERKIMTVVLMYPDELPLDEIIPRMNEINFSKENITLCREMVKCYNKHEKLDPTLFDIDINNDEFKYLYEYIEKSEAKKENVNEYLDKVEELDKRLKVKEILQKIDFNKDYMDVINDVTRKLDSIAVSKEPTNTMITGKELALKYLENMDKKIDPRDKLKTGIKCLDEMINLNKQDLWIIGGRPSMGKTAVMLTLAKNMAKNGLKVGIFSLEMPTIQLMDRMYSSISGVPLSKIQNRMMNEAESSRFHGSIMSADYVLENMFFFEGIGTTINELELIVKQKKKEFDLDCIFIDYLQFVNNNGSFDRNDLKIADTTKRIKILLKKLNIAGCVLAQLSRKPEGRADRRPEMSDLDGSSEIEKTADIITFLYRDSYYNMDSEEKDTIEFITAKQRNGAVGRVSARFLMPIQRISDF